MLQEIFGLAVLAVIFFAGTYALARMIPSKIFNWIFVGIVFLGIVLPCVLTGQAVGLGIAIGGATLLGTRSGLRAGSVWINRQ